MRCVIHRIYWVLCIFIVIELLSALYLLRTHGDNYMPLFSVSFSTYICFSAVKFTFVLFLLGNDCYRLIAGICLRRILPRSRIITWLGVCLAFLSLNICMYGVTYGKYNYKVHSHAIYFDDLPPAFDGFKIVAISDIHAGSILRTKPVQRGVNLINAQQGDLVVFLGDLVNSRSIEFAPLVNYFGQLRASHGKYAIMGNHDYGDYARWSDETAREENVALLKKYFYEMEFRVLLNEHVTIEKDGQSIALIGVEDWGKGFSKRGNLSLAASGIDGDSFKILLTHNPTHWEEQVKNNPVNIQLSIAGHTHGMQVGIEIPGVLKWSPAQYMYPHWGGLTKENNRYLYVSRGFGFLGLPGRIGILPEITVIELKRKIR